ncbi:hypothetical protein MKY64_31780 [Paenibacillus sp. FSL R7-0210]|uniref:hypothetical protein n=1 Tax=Paenibacillus sp. FSL R7-0210 TaxID=2921676 RepID=UPI0030FAB8E4
MEIDSSKAVIISRRSVTIWKAVHKQSLRMNNNLDMVNRSVKGFQAAVKRSSEQIIRAEDRIIQSLQQINDTLLEGFKRLPVKVDVSRTVVMQQSQRAAQSQQLGVRMLEASPAVEKTKEEEAKKVNWWKGLKEKKKKEEKKPEVKKEDVKPPVPEVLPKPKINLKKDPVPPPPPPPPPSPPGGDSKIMKFLKTADVVKPFNAIKSFGEKAVKEAALPEDIANWNKMNKNIDLALGQIGTKALGALRPVMDTINNALTSGQLAPLIDAMANGFLFIANVISMVVDGLLWLAQVVQDNWSFIKPILEAIAIVFLAAMIVQVYMLAAAWLAANWPILIVIAVIAVLLMILQHLGVSAGEVVGFIVGSFYYLAAVVQNIAIGIQNFFTLAGDGLVFIFNWAVNKVQGFFYGLAAGALDVMYSIAVGAEGFAGGFMKVMAKAIQWVLDKFNSLVDMLSNIPFFDTLGISKVKIDVEEPETPHGASDIIAKYRQGLEVYKPADKVVLELSKQKDYKDTKAAFGEGNQTGKNIVNNFMDKGQQMADKAKELTNPKSLKNIPGGSTNAFANQTGSLNNVNKVGEVGKIRDKVDVSSDDLDMLRELAEIQSIQNFVELTPTVQVTTGNINNSGDIDSIITKIGQKLKEEFVSTAQGVYT